MKSLNNLGSIKETAQMLDTAAVQWINANPPEHVLSKLNEARSLLQRGMELVDAPLRVALVGEFNSGKTLLLNALLDSTDLFPCLLQPTTGNVLEVKVNLTKEERRAQIRQAKISFFNQFEIDSVLEHYVRNLQSHGIDGIPSKVTSSGLKEFENLILRKFAEVKSITPKYALFSALEFVMALQNCSEIIEREERHSCKLPLDLISSALTLTGRPDLGKGIQSFHAQLKQMYDKVKSQDIETVNSSNLRALFPIVRRVEVDVSAWCVPFGINNPDDHNTLAFLDFPGLGAESSSARDEFLCMSEIRDAHAVLVVFNGSNPGTSGASVMATLFQRAGKLTTERTIVAMNRFDEFHPLPTGRSVEEYYSKQEQGTSVGFQNILLPAKNLLASSTKDFKPYICSALCYLFEEKSRRPHWNFGNAKWFNDNKRQAAYTLYKRSAEDFQAIIDEVNQSRTPLQEYVMMKDGLQRYLQGGGISPLRQDLVKFTMERGERLVKEDALKEIRAAQRILDEVSPASSGQATERGINNELSFAAQEFYRVLELSVADTLPSGPSDYKRLKLRGQNGQDVPIWEVIESEIAANVTSWPEWFAILNQGILKPKEQRGEKPKRAFGRYSHIKKQGGEAPTKFEAFDERFKTTAESLTQFTLNCISEAIRYSLERFENHPDYRSGIEHLQSMIHTDKLPNIEEALPMLDVWNPSQLADEDIIPLVLERTDDEVEALKSMSYPYDGSKPCFWNLALIIRVQVQLMKTYRDRLSRLVASAENNFQDFFCNEVLRAEILPLVRSSLNNPDFLGEIATQEAGVTWESVGQVVRSAVEEFKSRSSSSPSRATTPAALADVPQTPSAPAVAPASSSAPSVTEEVMDEEFEEETGDIIDDEEFEEW